MMSSSTEKMGGAARWFRDLAQTLDDPGGRCLEDLKREAVAAVMTLAVEVALCGPDVEEEGVRAWLRARLGPAEEAADRLGPLYESLLDLELVRGASGQLRAVQPPRRARSDVHYTPPEVARRIVEMALAPVVKGPGGALRPPAELASLRVCDPSMGCGVFLLASARALSSWLWESWRHHEGTGAFSMAEARRAVVDTMLYGVDLDPIAVDVTRCALGLFAGGAGGSADHLLFGDALSAGPGDQVWGQAFAEVFESPRGGFDAVIGNPPYLFGERRPPVDEAAFEMCRGQWDVWWLFVERAVSWSALEGSFGLLLPDSVLTRESTRPLRRLMRSRASKLWLRHEGSVFGAGVSVVACCGWTAAGPPTMTYERVVEGGVEVLDVDLGLDPDSGDDACLFWPPRRPEALLPLLLGDHVSLSRGEEVGKSSLEKVGAAEVLGRAEILAGEGVGARYVQPRATHLIEPSRLVKSASRYSAPKVVVVKTGGRVKAAIDREGHATLQSVYNIHLKRGAPPWMTLEFVCGLLNCEEVHRRFIAPFTSGKMLFPQITQRMLREIRLPEVSAAQAGEVSEAVRAAENAEVGAAERVQELFGPLFPGSAG